MRTIFTNVRVLTPRVQRDAVVIVRDGRIGAVCGHFEPLPTDRVIDGQGRYLAPGFIDLHVHGGGGRSVMEGTAEAVLAVGDAHAAFGTTSLLPTTLAMPIGPTEQAIRAIQKAIESNTCRSNLLGAHLEGPCLSPLQSGAQAPGSLLIPAKDDLSPLLAYAPIIKMMGIAPELHGALALGDWLAERGVVPSIAHSNATYAEIAEAVRHGFSDVTHLYSCCSSVVRINAYRVSGVVEAGLEMDALTTQVIADGKHLPDELLRLIYRCKGADGMYAITDGLEFSASDVREGTTYTQHNGMPVLYEDGVMKLPDRTAFAGSVATMNRCVRTLVSADIPLPDAVRMATETPANRLNLFNKGRVASGCDADLILFDDAIDVSLCMVAGDIRFGA